MLKYYCAHIGDKEKQLNRLVLVFETGESNIIEKTIIFSKAQDLTAQRFSELLKDCVFIVTNLIEDSISFCREDYELILICLIQEVSFEELSKINNLINNN